MLKSLGMDGCHIAPAEDSSTVSLRVYIIARYISLGRIAIRNRRLQSYTSRQWCRAHQLMSSDVQFYHCDLDR